VMKSTCGSRSSPACCRSFEHKVINFYPLVSTMSHIYNAAGTLQANVIFGAATVGRTFDNAAGLTGLISQLSTVGVNGAFLGSADGRIGSPSVVPVPAAAWLLGSAFGVLGIFRRRRAA